MPTITEIGETALPQIAAHWASCEEGGLPHTSANRELVWAAFERFFQDLEAISGSHEQVAVTDALQRIYGELDKINDAFDDRLLETDERELLVPIIIDAVAAAGFDPDAFPDGEPGGEFRNF